MKMPFFETEGTSTQPPPQAVSLHPSKPMSLQGESPLWTLIDFFYRLFKIYFVTTVRNRLQVLASAWEPSEEFRTHSRIGKRVQKLQVVAGLQESFIPWLFGAHRHMFYEAS